MKSPIHILQLEDNPNDTLLIQRLLEREGYVCDMMRVEGRNDFIAALRDNEFDLILSDMKLPGFDGLTALQLSCQLAPDIPFIIVSGTMGEDAAIESLVNGATDYVLKTRMARLVPAVRRALQESGERKQRMEVERELKKFSALLEQTADSIVVTDRDGVIEYVNPGFEKNTGYSRSEVTGKTPRILRSGVHPKEFYEVMWKTILSGKVFRAEFRNRRKSGELYDQEETITPVLNAQGIVTHFVSTGRDISERRRAEEDLRDSEQRFRMLFEFSPDACYLMDHQGIFIDGNRAAENLFGYTKEDLVGKNFFKLGLLGLADLSRAAELVVVNTSGKITGPDEFQLKTRDGKKLTVEMRTLPMKVGGRTLVVGIARDVTEQKQAENVVRASELRFRSVWEHSADGMRLTDYEGRIIEVNDSFCALVQMPREKLVGQLFSVIYKRGGQDDDITMYHDRFKTGKIVPHLLAPITLWNGEVKELELSNSFIDSGTQGKMILSVFRDITERKRVERQSALLAHTLRSAKDCISVTDRENRILFVNESFASTYGYEESELLGKDISIVWASPESPGRFGEVLPATLQGGWHGELTNRRKDGTEFQVEVWTSVVRDEQGEPIALVGIARDITDRRRFEEQMRQVQKMDSIGTLAGGIAHDFNNILAIILGHAAMLDRANGDPGQIKRRADAISAAVQRGADLVRQILVFARKSGVKLEPVNINDTITELSGMLRDTFPRTIEIVLDLDRSLPVMMMDHTQLHQALLNLCVNGRDAMMDNGSTELVAGVLAIKTSVVNGTELQHRFAEATDGRYACIAVSDTGAGMDSKVRRKIFEPFFTTKETGKGTGLGLAVVYGIVQSHRGHVEVRSEPGRGSSFLVYLPFPADHPIVKESQPSSGGVVRGGSETILLVEDEIELLTVMKVAMEGKGYMVLTAQDGIEAVDAYKQNADQIALVLSDVGLPKLDGAALFSRLKGFDPGINFMLASGYLSPSLKSDLLQSGVKAFIQKPYDPQEVLRTIRDIIDRDT